MKLHKSGVLPNRTESGRGTPQQPFANSENLRKPFLGTPPVGCYPSIRWWSAWRVVCEDRWSHPHAVGRNGLHISSGRSKRRVGFSTTDQTHPIRGAAPE